MSVNLILIAKIIALLFILNYSARLLTKTLSNFAKYFRVSSFAIGIVFMAVATSIPELFIGIQSALNNASELSLGTVLGSNISDLALVLGIIILVAKRKIRPKNSVKIQDAWWMFVYALVPIFLSLDGIISKIDAVILIIMFIVYTYYVFLAKQKIVEKFRRLNKKRFMFDMFKFIAGIALLLLSSHYLVIYGLEIANNFAIPLLVIGITLYALSTSLPELIFETRAVREGKEGIAFGDLIGSIIVNSSLVLGITAIINPILIENIAEYVPAIFVLFIVAGYFFHKVLNNKKLATVDGLILIGIYVFFLIIEFGILELKF